MEKQQPKTEETHCENGHELGECICAELGLDPGFSKPKNWQIRFDEKFPDAITQKYGKGFQVWCSFCNGERQSELKSFITTLLAEQKAELKEEYRMEREFDKEII